MKYNPFDEIMSTREAARKWDLNQDSVKRLARQGKIIAQKLDEGDPYSPYLILKDQPKPHRKRKK